MLKKNLRNLLIFLIALTAGIPVIAQPSIDFVKNNNANFFDLQSKFDEYWSVEHKDDTRGWKKFKRWENFWQTRIMPDGSFPHARDILKELEEFKKITPQSQSDKIWKNIGPSFNPTAPQKGIGRVNVIRFNPLKSKEIWLGAASGGVWHSTDKGKTWKVFDFTQSLSIGISDIAFSQSNGDVVYVATGDADGIGASYSTYSTGVIKTTDGGKTWSFTNLEYALGQGKIVAALQVHPDNPDIVLAATSNGIFKTTDGGETWNVKTGDNGYYRAMTQSIDEPGLVLATTYSNSGAAIYRSTNFGDTWTKVQTLNGVRRAAIDLSDANGKYAYVLATNGSYFHSFWRSTNGGKTWRQRASINNTSNILGFDKGTGADRTRGQGWYDLAIAVSPFNENVVYTGGVNIWRTEDGGKTFTLTTHWRGSGGKPYVHADIHCLEFSIFTGFLFSGSDGGIDYSDDPENRWINLNKGLAITQYYKIAVAGDRENFVYGGAQDNGTHQYDNGAWRRVYGADGMDCAIDFTDYKRAIISIYYGQFFKTINGSSFYRILSSDITREQGAWVTPIQINPKNPKSFYVGYKNLWKTTNAGGDWYKMSNINIGTILNIAVSKKDTNVIYISSASVLSKSTDGGRTFNNISGAPSPIKGIAIDAENPHRIWIAVGGFSSANKVLMYDGEKWTNMTGNIPNIPVNSIVYQENSPDRLYIGTDAGVMFSDYNTAYWEFYGSEMPNVIVSDLEIDYASNKLYAGTYGRGIWVTDLNTCNEPQPDIKVEGETEICQGDSVKLTALTDEDNIVWSTGETGKSIMVSKTGIYSYSLPDVGGCPVRSKSVSIFVKSVPKLKIKPLGNYPLCKGDPVDIQLSASFGFSSYKWSTGETKRKISISGPGVYTVVATTKSGCEVVAKFEVVEYDKPEKPTITRVSDTELLSSPAEAYQWYLNDDELSGETSRNLIVKELGSYKVEVFNEFDCSNISDPMEIITDVAELDEHDVKIFPNPTTGKLMIDVSAMSFDRAEVNITDLLGREVFSGSMNSQTSALSVDLSNFASGVFIVKITIGNKTIIRRVVKQ